MFALIIQQIIATALAAFALLAPTPSMATATPVVIVIPAVRRDLPPMPAVVDGFVVVHSDDGCIDWPDTPYPVSADQPNRYCYEGWQTLTGGRVRGYYVPAIRTAVVPVWADPFVLAHETCHAHQHLTVLQELGREPSIDLREWLLTVEARASALGKEEWADRCAQIALYGY